MLDNKDHRLKACAAGIVKGIIHDHLTVRPHRVDLLHTAVAAAHASRHDHQYRFVHIRFLPYLSRSRGRIFIVSLYSILDRKTI